MDYARYLCIAGVWLATTTIGAQPEAQALRERFRAAQPAQTADRSLRVFGRQVSSADRLVTLQFAQDWREQFARFVGVEPRDWPTDLVLIPTVEDGPLGVAVRQHAPDAGLRAIVELSPQTESWWVREALCRAWLRLYWQALEADLSPPSILAPGLARYLSMEVARREDADDVLIRWSNARLPGVGRLIETALEAPYADLPVATQLSLFLLHSAPRVERFQRLAVAPGDVTPHTPDWLAERLLGETDLVALDALWDRWLLSRGTTVLTPGALTPEMLMRFRSQLRLYPGESGMPLIEPLLPGFGFAILIDQRHQPWAGEVADARIVEMVRHSGGRHADLQEVADAYVAFLRGIRVNLSDAVLERRLARAEQKLNELMRRVFDRQ